MTGRHCIPTRRWNPPPNPRLVADLALARWAAKLEADARDSTVVEPVLREAHRAGQR